MKNSFSVKWKCIFYRILHSGYFPHFSDTLSSESYFRPSGSVFLNESSNPHDGGVFSVLWKPFSLIYNLFIYKWNPSLKLVETHFFGGKTLFQLSERDFLSIENSFLLFRASFLQVKTVTETS